MPQNNSQVKTDLGSLIGTKDILNSIVGKLSSQIFLFSIAIIVLLLVSYSLWGSEGIIPTVAILVIFIIAIVSYLFFEQKQKIEKGEPEAVSNLLENKMKKISNTQSNLTSKVDDLNIELYTEKVIKDANSRDITVVPAKSGDTYKLGDKINIVFRSSKNCYLTLLNIGTSGKFTILYPNKLHQNNYINGGETYKIPGEEYGFEYRLEGPPGTEKLKAIITEAKINFVESQFTDGGLFNTISPGAAARDIKIIEKKVEELPVDKWNEAYFEFKVTGV